MSQLEDDLKKYQDDALSKKDAKAAIKLVGEVCGFVAVMYVAGTVIAALFGPAGLIPASAGACGYMFRKCGEAYSSLSADERTLVRKLARALRGIIS